jgi:hypothetical protein
MLVSHTWARPRACSGITWRTTITDIEKTYEPGTPTDRQPYMDECEKMSFAQLKRFIHDALVSRSDPSILANEELPHSKDEFLNLCDMLREKANMLKNNSPMPERPVYEGPAHPGRSFTPSEELEALYRKRRKAERRVNDAIRYGESGTYLEYLERERAEVEREIAPIERAEKQEYETRLKKRLREYQDAYEAYRRRDRQWRAEAAKIRKRREADANRNLAVQRTYLKVKYAFGPKRAPGPKRMGTLPWEIAAPGERSDDRAVYGYYREVMSQGRLDGFDQERLDKILALPYKDWLKGKAGFYGYIVLRFDHTEKALMECPIYGNAIYVLDSGEERLLKMNKQQLIASGKAKRIFHTGDWYGRVKRELGI